MSASDTEIDFLAGEVLAAFADAGLDEMYIESKRHELKGRDRFSCLVYLNCLDERVFSALARRLKVSETDLLITAKTARYL